MGLEESETSTESLRRRMCELKSGGAEPEMGRGSKAGQDLRLWSLA